jgi:hypothetical protein
LAHYSFGCRQIEQVPDLSISPAPAALITRRRAEKTLVIAVSYEMGAKQRQ